MKAFYKVCLVIFVILIVINFYAIDWELGIFNRNNDKFLLSISIAVVGIFVVLKMNTLSKLRKNR